MSQTTLSPLYSPLLVFMERTKHLVFSSFILKIIAMAAVLSDHIAYAFITPSDPIYSYMRIFGRVAFALFAFFISEGVVKSRNKDRYLLRLLYLYLFMQVAIIAVNLFDSYYEFSNIFATLGASASALVYLEKRDWKKLYYLLPLVVISAVNLLVRYGQMNELVIYAGDYNMYGIALIFGYYLARKVALWFLNRFPVLSDEGTLLEVAEENKRKQVIFNSAASLSLLIITFIWYILSIFGLGLEGFELQSFALLTIPLLLLYSGKLGHNSKPFRITYYLFFPVHLVILAIFSYL